MSLLLPNPARHEVAVGLQRHFSRARDPKPGEIWDFDCPLAEKAGGQAASMRQIYFPEPSKKPSFLFASCFPRARETAQLMWPESTVLDDMRLGPKNAATADHEWAAIQNVSVTASGAEIYAVAPNLVEVAGHGIVGSVYETVAHLHDGNFAWLASHCPYTDVAALIFREKLLGLPKGTGWYPGQFGSGAFLWLVFEGEALELKRVEYYPALLPR